MQYDTIIIGSGVSALGAAIYCGRFQLKTLVIGEKSGGTIILTDDVSNYPGFKKISGMDLFDNIQEHAKSYDIEILEKKVIKAEKCKDCFKVSASEKTYSTKTIIFATGTEWRKLNIPGEKEFTNKGVHYCALCDGALYKNKTLAVIGGSDSAAKEAILLSNYGKKVYIIYRKDKIRAEPITSELVKQNKKIEIIYNTNLTEIKGDKFVKSIILDKAYKNSKELNLDAVFVDIGHIPLSDLASSIGIKTNDKGEIMIDKDSKTNINGIFAAGDVVDSKFKQAITGVAEGVIAAYNVYQFVTNKLPVCGCSDDS
ncbi:MAG: FAD-dependent oxidoreductase [Nanoarchaeota archaeon]|nr:FAD-dependent oxidoreductase [Nanoarchaeota archaeon]MBU1005701.1 FAD-dependent oxidoreductase [Nanoarchaeota archaeon]MBU1946666.1 FAD-dependent oxidoreductase [Nanoarchaeota archaeon]